MDSLDLRVRRKGVLAQFASDATLFVTAKRNRIVRVLRAVDLEWDGG